MLKRLQEQRWKLGWTFILVVALCTVGLKGLSADEGSSDQTTSYSSFLMKWFRIKIDHVVFIGGEEEDGEIPATPTPAPGSSDRSRQPSYPGN